MRDNIVVLDDEPDIKKILRIVKLALNIQPEKFVPGEEEGVQKVATLVSDFCKPDVIKLEIKIPGVDSVELIKKIRSDPQLGRIFTPTGEHGV